MHDRLEVTSFCFGMPPSISTPAPQPRAPTPPHPADCRSAPCPAVRDPARPPRWAGRPTRPGAGLRRGESDAGGHSGRSRAVYCPRLPWKTAPTAKSAGVGWIASSAVRASAFSGSLAKDVDPSGARLKMDALPGERGQLIEAQSSVEQHGDDRIGHRAVFSRPGGRAVGARRSAKPSGASGCAATSVRC